MTAQEQPRSEKYPEGRRQSGYFSDLGCGWKVGDVKESDLLDHSL
jgi:hypothetical protein